MRTPMAGPHRLATLALLLGCSPGHGDLTDARTSVRVDAAADDAAGNALLDATRCGDGVLDLGEACDTGASNSDIAADACRTTCVAPRCGDGVVDTGEACDGSPLCLPSCQIQLWSPAAYVKASNTGANDFFGYHLTISGDGLTLAVGARQESSNSSGVGGLQGNDFSTQSGAVYVFARPDRASAWTQQAFVKAGANGAFDQFGIAVDLSFDGNTLAVGAQQERSNATTINGNQGDNSAGAAGAAYIFVRAGTSWTQQAYLKTSTMDADDYMGAALSISHDGDTLVVSCYREDGGIGGDTPDPTDNSAANAGAAFVFTRAGATWSQDAYLKARIPRANDAFGARVSISADGSTIAVGAWNEDGASSGVDGDDSLVGATDSGAVHVFRRGVAGWRRDGYIKAPVAGAGDHFGWAITLSRTGEVMGIGAPNEDSGTSDPLDDSVLDAGAYYVLRRRAAGWRHEAYLKGFAPGPGDLFGEAAVLDEEGHVLVVGAPFEDGGAVGLGGDPTDDSVANAGAAFAYIHGPDGWSPVTYLKSGNPGTNDGFGSWLAFDATISSLVIGAFAEAGGGIGLGGDPTSDAMPGAGAVYTFELPP